jgi:hypothetical protein
MSDGLPKWWEKVGFGHMCSTLLAVSGMICLSFRDRFDGLLEKRLSGVAEHKI